MDTTLINMLNELKVMLLSGGLDEDTKKRLYDDISGYLVEYNREQQNLIKC